MWSQPARRARSMIVSWRWPILAALLVTGVHAIGWRSVGHAVLVPARFIADVGGPVLGLVWPGFVALALASLISRQGRSLLARARRVLFPWPVAGLAVAVLGLVLLSVLVFPGYLVQRSLNLTATRLLSPAERLKAENDARTTLLQGVAGLLLIVGAGATWRQIHINREGQITERFNKAIDHLGEGGDDKIDVRLGGIYALERIANNSKDDQAMIAEILTAYVRGHAPWNDPLSPATSIKQLLDLRVRAPDVQAVMTVLGRREPPAGKAQPLLLTRVDLRKADLVDANLDGANFVSAHLEGADLGGAHLQGAGLRDAHLQGANLARAHLQGADFVSALLDGASLDGAHLERAMLLEAHLDGATLFGAHLDRANLFGAHLQGAWLHGAYMEWAHLNEAHLERAQLNGAHLNGAKLVGAHLEGADLGGADLDGADLSDAHLDGADLSDAHLDGADLSDAHLQGARASYRTSWPKGFHWHAAGVQTIR